MTRKDAQRIDALGYSRDEYLVRAKDGFCELKNVNGFCYFYDPETKHCRIYEHRPDGCRYYPIVYHAKKSKCITDMDCPSRETVSREEIRKVCHRVKKLIATLQREVAFGEGPC